MDVIERKKTYSQCQSRYLYFIFLGGLIFLLSIFYSDDQLIPVQLHSFVQRVFLPNLRGNANFSDSSPPLKVINGSNGTNEPTVVLIWTPYFGKVWNEALHMFDGCPQSHDCIMTVDRSRASESVAILFHIRDLSWSDIPKHRNIDQHYIFVLWESPHHTGIDLSIHPDFFNLTVTYRVDSDGIWPYGRFRSVNPRSNSTDQLSTSASKIDQLSMIVKGKSKLIAWFVSNCGAPSGRGRLVQKLKEYISVDIYGSCGRLKCGIKKGGTETGIEDAPSCNQLLTKDYKFYLSFENSLCRDYVTEKLYFHMDNSLIVPIVMERKIVMNTILDKETAGIIGNSIIAVDDFPDLKQLADYLKYLDQNTTEYMKYFQWRETHEVVFKPEMCQLCNVIRERKEHKINSIADWWINGGQCHSWK